MSDELPAQRYPELVFGLAGPMGIEIDELTAVLGAALKDVHYECKTIKITEEMMKWDAGEPAPASGDFYSLSDYKIKYANSLCRMHKDPAFLMRVAIQAIRRLRDPGESDPVVTPRVAYIIRQLKRPEEVQLLRKVYGRQFILVSAYGSLEQRRRIVETKLKRTMDTSCTELEVFKNAQDLISRDANEDEDDFGQHLRDTFHLADVFVDGISKPEMEKKVVRFVEALFGKNDIAPSKAEYGMYAAKSASLRSSDLSRQVGAAIFADSGELIVQGCNEVPKAFGGTYWDLEDPDFRDVKIGHDPNDILKKEVLRDLIERLFKNHMLSEKALELGLPSKIVDAVLTKPLGSDAEEKKSQGYGCLAGAAVTELTEYGRVVHAEMCAICDAARIGRSLKGAILYCTTFPCHNCTKHILASGIARVIYMEPYPKSKAKELHENEIEIEREANGKVSFLPFLGIAPQRYRDIFQKGKRKKDGAAIPWYKGEPRPMIDVSAPGYLDAEVVEAGKLAGKLKADQGQALVT